MPFTVLPQPRPTITTIDPLEGESGTEITIQGNSLQGATQVTLGDASMEFTQVAPTQILATVPNGAGTGKIRVTTPAGTAASIQSFVINSSGSASEIDILQDGTLVTKAKILDLIGLEVATGDDPDTAVIRNLAEINTASNLGNTGARLFAGKLGVDLQFRRLVAGENIELVETADDVTIAVTGLENNGGGTGGTGNAGRVSANFQTDSLAPEQSANYLVEIANNFLISKVVSSHACWFRIYSSTSARAADENRLIINDPKGDHGVILETIHTDNQLSINLSPQPTCLLLSATLDKSIPIRVTNKSTIQSVISFSLDIFRLD